MPVRHPTPGEVDTMMWFDATAESVGSARAFLRDQLGDEGCGPEELGYAELLISELATNVVRHSASTRMGVTVAVTEGRLRVAVSEDRQSDVPQHVIDVAVAVPDEVSHGRGLAILDWLAAEWGVTRRDQTTTTWFTVALADDASPDGAAQAEGATTNGLERSLEAARDRSRLLLGVVEELAAATDADKVADVIIQAIRDHVGAVFSGIALRDPDGQSMRYVSLDPLPAQTAAAWTVFPFDDTAPVSAAALHQHAYFHEDPASADAEFPGIAAHMTTAGTLALAHVPLVVEREAIGTLALAWAQPRQLDPDLRALLTIVAGYAAQALARR